MSRITKSSEFFDTLPPMIPIDLRNSGLLWLINRAVFHPRGFALAVNAADGSLGLFGNGAEPWGYDLGEDVENELFRQAEATFAEARLRGEVAK